MNTVVAMIVLQLAAQSTTPLDKAAQTAELFWDQFGAVHSVEQVTRTELKENGKVASSQTAEFDYVALLKPKANGLAVEESRVSRSNAASDRADQLLLTSGFPAFLLLFHPDLRDKFDFQMSPDPAAPAGTVRIAFKSRPGVRSMSALKLNGRLYPILWQGFAWVQESTGTVSRIVATLDGPMDDLGLAELRTEVEYKAVRIQNSGQTYNLPARVTVSARTPKRQWRNIHEFSNYKLFTVTTFTSSKDGRP